SREYHLNRSATQSPGFAQGREEQQIRFVLEDLGPSRPKTPQITLNLAFFSLPPDRERARIAAASMHSPTHAAVAEQTWHTVGHLRSGQDAPAIGRPSTRPPYSQIGLAGPSCSPSAGSL